MRLERANSKKPVNWLSLLGLVLIPIIVAAGFILATWKSGDRLETIEAAIVNNDDGAKVDGKTVPIGRQLTSGLVGEDDNNIHWVITDEEDAQNGLSDGTYAAKLTIPEGFSRAVTSVDDAKSATQTQLDVDVSGTAPALDTQISRSVAEVARTTFNTQMTENYLDNIYVGFNKMGDQMKDLGDAAGELDKGAEGLKEGTGQSAEGAGELSTGMKQLSDNGGELKSGATELSKGAGELSKGASEMSGGLNELDKKTSKLPESTQKLADGSGELSDGVDEYTKSIDEIIKGFAGSGDSGEGGLGDITKGGKELEEGAKDLSTGVSGLSDGLHQYRDGLNAKSTAASSAISLDDLVSDKVITDDDAKKIRAGLCPAGTPEQSCKAMETAYAQGLSGGMKGAADGLEQEDSKTEKSLLSAADELKSGAKAQSKGMTKFVRGLEDGLGELTKGMEDISKNAPKLLEASKGLRDGAAGVADGNQQLADGMPALSKGIGKVADGSSELSDGAGQLSDGLSEYSTGVGKYTDGVSEAATGTSELAAGLDKLDEGTGKYAKGVSKFSDGVKDGADEVPSYTAPERDRLAKVASANIDSPDTDSVTDVLAGSTIALLIMLALWIGGLVTYTVLKPIPAWALLSTKSSFAVWARGLLPGLVVGVLQALVLSILAVTVMDIDAIQSFDIAVLTFVSAIVFMILNFALVAWFGGVGRFLSVIAVVLAVAGRTIGAVPQFFDFVAPILPLTPSMNGFAAIAAGTTGQAAAYGGLLAWAVIGIVMSLLAIVRARTTKPEAALEMA
ncbi:YhgE/Pip family protein [Brevibacterium permense]|uniref:YhgE/Pip domain-containing protein n=1 Tax=Brevibacterium permense TaxID=234834 RepID=A0ABP4L0V1_9MICO